MPANARREWAAALALAFACLLSTLVQTIVIPIQAQLPELIGADAQTTSWVVTVTIAVACALSPVTGRLGDLYGRRRVAYALLIGQAIGAILCAIAWEPWALIVGRGFQGLAVGLIPLSMSILSQVISPSRLPAVVAAASSTLGIGAAFGLPLGAWLSATIGWRGLFWLCLLLGVIAIIGIRIAVPRVGHAPGGRFDVGGAVLNIVGSGALIFGLDRSVTAGWADPVTITTLAGGAAALLAGGWHMLRTAYPLVDMRVAVRPRVLLTNIVSGLQNFAAMGILVALPQVLTAAPVDGVGIGLDPLAGSAVLMLNGISQFLATPVAAHLTRTHDPRLVLAGGVSLVAGALGFSLLGLGSLPALIAVNVVAGLGLGAAFAAIPQIIMAAVPAADVAAANGVNAQVRMFGTASAAAVIGAIVATLAAPASFIVAVIAAAASAVAAAILSFTIPPQR